MNDDVRKIIYRTLTVFAVGVVVWLSFLFINACGFSFACAQGAAVVERTPIPTLIPATMPAPTRFAGLPAADSASEQSFTINPNAARPSNPGEPGDALNLTGSASAGAEIFAANCVACHGAEGKGGVANPGSKDGVVPTLNPVPADLKDADAKAFAYNIDLFIQHGSKPEGASPILQMPAWGDLESLTQQQIADVIAYLISLNP